MARANLNIDSSVTEAFLSAQESQTVRLITVKIVNEALTLDSTFDKAGSVPEDFDSLLPSTFQLTEAVFGIFNATDGDGAQSWVLVVWIPEGCRVRDKMLYSSSREDLKKSLGLGYFKSDYGANQFEDLTWNRYLESIRKEFSIDHLTETERLILEEKVPPFE